MLHFLIGIAVGTIFSGFIKQLFDILLVKMDKYAEEQKAAEDADDTPTT
jgi:hypothetical protein